MNVYMVALSATNILVFLQHKNLYCFSKSSRRKEPTAMPFFQCLLSREREIAIPNRKSSILHKYLCQGLLVVYWTS